MVVAYFNNMQQSPFGLVGLDPPTESPVAQRSRSDISRRCVHIHRIVQESGVSSELFWSPPPMIGGRRVNLDLFFNLFLLHRYSVDPNLVLDCLRAARGVYEYDEPKALIRTFNPLWWVKRMFVAILHVPFSLFRVAGFNTTVVENSLFGKLVKLIVGTISLIAAALVSINLLGGMDWFKNILGIDEAFWEPSVPEVLMEPGTELQDVPADDAVQDPLIDSVQQDEESPKVPTSPDQDSL